MLKPEQMSIFDGRYEPKRAQFKNQFTDGMIGHKFGGLTVIKPISKRAGKYLYACLCDCGKTTNIRSDNLRGGHTISCGCSRQETGYDITGMVVGDLTVIKQNGKNKRGEWFWDCRCVCGNVVNKRGRSIRKGDIKTHCGCKTVKKEKPEKIRRKAVNKQQFAHDLYNVYIKQGVNIREAARMEGYKTGSQISALLLEYVKEYREASIKRRDESEYRTRNRRTKKRSSLFRFEKDLQAACCDRLKAQGVEYEECNREHGFEIDIMTHEYCYELKVGTLKKDIYRAIGQLTVTASRSGLSPALVIPSDTVMHNDLYEIVVASGIKVCNELDI